MLNQVWYILTLRLCRSLLQSVGKSNRDVRKQLHQSLSHLDVHGIDFVELQHDVHDRMAPVMHTTFRLVGYQLLLLLPG